MINEHRIVPSGAAAVEAQVVPVLDVILDPGVDPVANTERSELNDWLRGPVHVVVGMVVLVIDG